MRKSRSTPRCALALILGSALGLLVTRAPAGDAQPSPSASISVRVADASAIPILRAEVIVETSKGRRTVPAGDEGIAVISFPVGPKDFLRVIATAPGHSPATAMWWMNTKSADLLPPKEMTLELRPGTRIGGTVVAPDDEPIGSATVTLNFKSAGQPAGLVYRPGRIEHGPWQIDVVTGANGRWSYDGAPEDWREASIALSHPDFCSVGAWTSKEDAREALLSETDVCRMERGRNIRGSVTDKAGHPVAGARIWVERVSIEQPQATADAEGKFQLRQASTKPFNLLITSGGRFAPQHAFVDAGTDEGSLDIALPAGKTLSGTIVDQSGKPVPDAFVRLSGWTSHRSFVMELSAETSAEGKFQLIVPAEAVQLVAVADGYSPLLAPDLAPDDSPHVIELRPAARVVGTVTDAVTGMPLERFFVSYSDPSRGEDHWIPPMHEFIAGKYELVIPQQLDVCRVSIQAPGYWTVDSDDLVIDGEPAVFDATLRRED